VINSEKMLMDSFDKNEWNIIIADYQFSHFNMDEAIKIFKKNNSDIPIIILSDQISEKCISSIMSYGADRLFMKDDLSKLAYTVQNEMEKSILKKDKKMYISEMKEKAERFESIINSMIDGIINLDSNFNIELFNPSAEKIFKYKFNEVKGKNIIILFPENLRVQQYDQLLKNLSFETINIFSLAPVTFQGQKSDGVSFTLEIITSKNKIRNRLNYTLIMHDITQKRQMESQFLRSQRIESIGALAGGIAHDLNNVLAPVLMGVQLFKKEMKDEKFLQILSAMEDSIIRGAEIIKQILTFARGIEGEKIPLQPKHIIKEVVNIISETFPKSIIIKSEIPNNLWSIIGEITQLQQVFLNLSLNAQDAMPNGGSLIFKAANLKLNDEYYKIHRDAKPGSYVVITVLDTGTGVSQKIINNIFDPFFTTKLPGKGTGLGLSTVQAIVRSHGGFITVKSIEGKYSEFNVHLPAVLSEEEILIRSENIEMLKGNAEKILVVDDEIAIREITKTTLENYGYEVYTAHDGIEALTIYETEKDKIKAVITDLIMPLMDGNATIKSLLKINPDVKIIIISGYAKNEQMTQDLKKPGIVYLEKPYTALEMLKTLKKVITGIKS
jgi:PAS domain S-box-containing protein